MLIIIIFSAFVNKFFVRIYCFILGEQEVFVNIAEIGGKCRRIRLEINVSWKVFFMANLHAPGSGRTTTHESLAGTWHMRHT